MVTQKEALFFRERDAKAHNGAKEEDAPGQSVSQSRRLPTALVFFSTELCGTPLARERKNNDNNNT